MKTTVRASLLWLAMFSCLLLGVPALAQVSSDFSNDKIKILEGQGGDHGYWNTTSSADPVKPLPEDRKALRPRMMARHMLEEYAEFLSPLRLPHTLWLFASDCSGGKGDSPHYEPWRHAINMCYSFLAESELYADYLVEQQKKKKLWTPVSREQYIAGLYAAVLMHETGHALFDQLDIPVFGRDEDGADEVAAFIALQFNKETAKTVIKGFAYMWELSGDPRTVPMDVDDPKFPKDPQDQCWVDPFCTFSDEHGTSSQRLYNTLCIAYGGDPATFQEFVDSGWLPPERAKHCAAEYQQVKFAFEKTIFPFVNQEQMRKVQERQWFRAEELGEQ